MLAAPLRGFALLAYRFFRLCVPTVFLSVYVRTIITHHIHLSGKVTFLVTLLFPPFAHESTFHECGFSQCLHVNPKHTTLLYPTEDDRRPKVRGANDTRQ